MSAGPSMVRSVVRARKRETLMLDSLSQYHSPNSQPNDFEIEPERVVPQIPRIQLDFFHYRNLVSPIDLRPPCYSGFELMAPGPCSQLNLIILVEEGWAGPYQRHFPKNHVDQLW